MRPGAAWPDDIRDMVIGLSAIIEGGNEYTGAEIAPLDTDAARRFAAEATAAGCRAIAVSAAFSPATSEHELRARDVLAAELGDAFPVSLSHEVGSLGLLERENATILNAALLSVASSVVDGFESALAAHELAIDAYLTQNDGTLLTAAEAGRFPVLTLGSGAHQLDARRLRAGGSRRRRRDRRGRHVGRCGHPRQRVPPRVHRRGRGGRGCAPTSACPT